MSGSRQPCQGNRGRRAVHVAFALSREAVAAAVAVIECDWRAGVPWKPGNTATPSEVHRGPPAVRAPRQRQRDCRASARSADWLTATVRRQPRHSRSEAMIAYLIWPRISPKGEVVECTFA